MAWRFAKLYRMTGRRKQALGPLVVCYDESGSMAGEKEIWAKPVLSEVEGAVVLALLFIARRQKRPFAAIAFGSAKEIRVKTIQRPEMATMADVLEVAEPFFNGSTDFRRPLMESQQIIEAGDRPSTGPSTGSGRRSGHCFERADVVFVTDGLCRVTPEFLAEFEAFKKRTGTRMFAVLVDVGTSAEVEDEALVAVTEARQILRPDSGQALSGGTPGAQETQQLLEAVGGLREALKKLGGLEEQVAGRPKAAAALERTHDRVKGWQAKVLKALGV